MFVLRTDNKPIAGSHPPLVRLRGRRRRPDGQEETVDGWAIPNETAVEISFDGEAVAVMMATPTDLEDFVVGFALTEGLVSGFDEIGELAIASHPQGITAALSPVVAGLARDAAPRQRGLEGRSGCGLCGVRSLDEAMRCTPAVTPRDAVPAAVIHRALDALDERQSLNAITRAVHGAAWCDLDGEILALREDVGRHNALDKLAGWMARSNVDPLAGFAIITSRCSYEMVQKAAVMNIGLVVAISAPTALAVAVAREAAITLAAVARADSHILFTA